MTQPEVWLRGPLPDVPALLQPVAHSLLQSREEIRATLARLDARLVEERPGGAASAGYHVRHAAGSLDRLLTYARGESLTAEQLSALESESHESGSPNAAEQLTALFDSAIERALAQVRATPESTLREARAVGRSKLPSTVIGLLFHAAEHTQRHAGQAMTTAKVVVAGHPSA